MADKQPAELKELEKQMEKQSQELDSLKKERLETLQQLRLGASLDVRKPTRIRRQIARILSQSHQLKLRQQSLKAGLKPEDLKKRSSKRAVLAVSNNPKGEEA